jgi:hypothetical protein
MEHRPQRGRIAVCSLFFALSHASAAPARAATLAAYDFDAGDGGFTAQPATLAPDIVVSTWRDADGSLTAYAGAPGRALGARHFTDGNSLLWSARAATGRALQLDGLRFDQQASTSGPKFWALRVNGDLVASGATTTTFTAVHVPLALPAQDHVEFALDGFEASSAQGTWRIDNFQLLGATAPVPVPPALPLLASGLLLLARRGRRRR